MSFWWPQSIANSLGNIVDPTIFECSVCSYQCRSPQALSWHAFDKHGSKHIIRQYLHSTVCECCLQDFHTRSRAFTHVSASSPKCKQFYRGKGTKVSDSDYEFLEKEALDKTKCLQAQGRRRTFAETMPVRTIGPLTEMAYTLGLRHDCLTKVPPRH